MKDPLLKRYEQDPGSAYSMTGPELRILLSEFGELEPIIDAIGKLEGQSAKARAEMIGVTEKDILADDDWADVPASPYWFCDECGYKETNRAMPTDRAKFYAKPPQIKCPKCRSIGFHPVGF